jgi:hypothetical protein
VERARSRSPSGEISDGEVIEERCPYLEMES